MHFTNCGRGRKVTRLNPTCSNFPQTLPSRSKECTKMFRTPGRQVRVLMYVLIRVRAATPLPEIAWSVATRVAGRSETSMGKLHGWCVIFIGTVQLIIKLEFLFWSVVDSPDRTKCKFMKSSRYHLVYEEGLRKERLASWGPRWDCRALCNPPCAVTLEVRFLCIAVRLSFVSFFTLFVVIYFLWHFYFVSVSICYLSYLLVIAADVGFASTVYSCIAICGPTFIPLGASYAVVSCNFHFFVFSRFPCLPWHILARCAVQRVMNGTVSAVERPGDVSRPTGPIHQPWPRSGIAQLVLLAWAGGGVWDKLCPKRLPSPVMLTTVISHAEFYRTVLTYTLLEK
jgi:hypothetical protein